ncbi:hypothetical protein FGIG_07432 [Fasciola gigantica]|uniref:G-protein coupled receptors family 1 profile domain-containing protein n=1 Tax=Fasciola gigantica TaxID=46835 RepID=A0A504YAM5_FASGI|nr:hypothetical protein FGIG_07432 [Fasciola gigantica]
MAISLRGVSHTAYIIGLFVNTFILIVMSRFRSKQDYQSYFDTTQNALDLTLGIVHLMSSFPLVTLPQMSEWNRFYCHLFLSRALIWAIISARGYVNLFVATHFFIKIALPFTRFDLHQRGPFWISVFLIVCASVLGAVPHLFSTSYLPDSFTCTSNRTDLVSAHNQLGMTFRIGSLLVIVHNYLVPISMASYFYYHIFLLLRRSSSKAVTVVKQELLIRFFLDVFAYGMCYTVPYWTVFLGCYWDPSVVIKRSAQYENVILMSSLYPSLYSVISLCTRRSYRRPCEELVRQLCRPSERVHDSSQISSISGLSGH